MAMVAGADDLLDAHRRAQQVFQAFKLSSSPVASMVSEPRPTSTIFARKTFAISMIPLRRSEAALTLYRASASTRRLRR